MKTIITVFVTLLLLCSGMTCRDTYTGIVTVTEIRHAVMNELGEELRAGRIDAATWEKVVQADNEYRKVARSTRIALERYRDFQEGDPLAAMLAVKATVLELINILAGYQNTVGHVQQLEKASKL